MMHDITHGKMDKKAGVTFRAVLIGLLLVPINVSLVVQWESVWYTQYPTTMAIFFNVIFSLFLLKSLNLALKKFSPKSALSQSELATIYIVLLLAVAVSGHDFSQGIFCTIGTAHWFATPENEWSAIFFRNLPPWLTISDDKVLRGLYEGESTFYTLQHIKGWLQPLVWWTAFLAVMVFSLFCINVIIRKQWIENEKLTYPLAQLPLEMSREEPSNGFFKNKLLWVGFGVAAGLDIINGLNFIWPSFPRIPLIYNLGAHFVDKPFNAIGNLPIQINPYAIGLAFPIPLDLLFSCWFFFLIWKGERVFGSAAGLNLSGYPFENQQILGSYLGIAAVVLFLGRKSLWQILLKVVGGKSEAAKAAKAAEADDSNEPLRYRTAALGFLLGTAFLVLFSHQAGMSLTFALSFFLVYFAIMFAFTRMRAELGPPLQGINYFGPLQFLVAMVGSRKISASSFTVAAPYWTFTKELRNNPMPFMLESLKIAEKSGLDTKKLWKVMMLSSLIGVILTFWIFLSFSYKWGGIGQWRGVSAYTFMERWITRPTETDIPFLSAVIFGFIFVLINTALRLRLLWWQLHPLGYPLAGYYHFEKLWFPFFISWAIKWSVLKYGGIKAYRKAFPIFLGLVLGEFVMGSIWGIVGLITGEPTYAFKNW